MGSPLSPIVADIVTDKLIAKATTKANIPAEYVKKYVDDLFLIVPRTQVNHILEVFNSYDEHLQFTCELERDGKLPFLDTLIIRQDDNTLKTDWYAKPMASGRLLNYHSLHPLGQKLGVATNFIDRVRSLSTVRTRTEQNQLIAEHLQRNDYPKRLVNCLLHQSSPQDPSDLPTSTSNPPTVYRSLPLIPGLTPTIATIIRHNNPHINIAPQNRHTVKQLYNTVKDPIPDAQKSNVIYKLTCFDCEHCYIGMTTNRLRERMYGHQTHMNTLERELRSGRSYSDDTIQSLREKTALVDHCITQQHRFDLKRPTIIDSTFKPRTLPFLEMCHIATTASTVNRRTDTDGLSCAYAHLLSSIAPSRESNPTRESNSHLQSLQPSITNTDTLPSQNRSPSPLTLTQPQQTPPINTVASVPGPM